MTKQRARTGRPPLKPGKPKRTNSTIRYRDETKRKLQEAAAREGRSISEEIEARLEASFREEEGLGGPKNYALFKLMASAAENVQEGQDWRDDYDTARAVLAAWEIIIEWAVSRVKAPEEVKVLQAIEPPKESEELKALNEKVAGEPNTLAYLAGKLTEEQWKVERRRSELLEEENAAWRAHAEADRALKDREHANRLRGIEATRPLAEALSALSAAPRRE